MILNHLFVVPDVGTQDYLKQVFQGCPFFIDFDSLKCSLYITPDAIEAEQGRVYTANAGTMGYWYETPIQASSIVLPLFSEQMQMEYSKLKNNARPAFNMPYVPAMVIVEFAPPRRQLITNFVNSVAEALVNHGQPLIFVNEVVESKEFDSAPHLEFTRDMVDRIERGLR